MLRQAEAEPRFPLLYRYSAMPYRTSAFGTALGGQIDTSYNTWWFVGDADNTLEGLQKKILGAKANGILDQAGLLLIP